MQILILEDNPSDAELIKRELRRAGLDFTVEWASDKTAFLHLLEEFRPDLLLADYSLPGFDGLAALILARQRFPGIPVIIVSGAIGEEVAIEALKAGATDYVLKQRLSRLGPVIQRAIEEADQRAGKVRAEDALRESEERLRLLVNGTKDYALLMLDPRGNIMTWNEGVRRLKGYEPDEVLGRHFSVFYTPDDVAAGKPPRELESALRDGKYEDEGERVRKDGSRFWASVFITPLWDERGRLRGFSKITHDITERKRADEELKRLVADLERSNYDLEQFAYISSHDLQEPLRQVSGFVEMLERHCSGLFDDQAKEFFGFITEGTSRMSVLIKDLLAYSRVGRTDKSIHPVNLAKITQDTLKTLRLRLEETSAEVTVDNLPVVRGNETMLGQLFQNLIGNALKFRGEKSPRIHIGCRREDGHWLICVRDNGIGFDQESGERIFEVFKRLQNRDSYEGTGIGLAICKRVVELHGGRIWAESEPGKGATFYFTLPVRQ